MSNSENNTNRPPEPPDTSTPVDAAIRAVGYGGAVLMQRVELEEAAVVLRREVKRLRADLDHAHQQVTDLTEQLRSMIEQAQAEAAELRRENCQLDRD